MDGFKQRIIGAVVIVSLAVIFLPMMFDEPHQERTRESIDIPDQPDFPQVRIERPQSPAEDSERQPVPAPQTTDTESPSRQQPSDAGSDTTASEPAPAPSVAQPPSSSSSEPSAPDSATLSGSYLVQLGSFGSSDNARALRDRVRGKGFDAYVEQFQRGENTLNRVFAGPFVNRGDAETAKSGLDEDLGLSTLIIAAGDND